MRTSSSIAAAAALSIVAVSMPAWAIGRSRVECKPVLLPTVKTSVPGMDMDPEPEQFPEALVEFDITINVQDPIPNALNIRKAQLTSAEAYGFGRPNGYTFPPPTDPTGPWEGLMWPYRDFNDGYAAVGGGLPPGDAVGMVDISGAGTGSYAIRNIHGRMSYNLTNPASWARGFPGNGVTDFADLFAFDIETTSAMPREVMVTMTNITALFLQRDAAGNSFVGELPIPDATMAIFIPSPGAAGLLGLAGVCAARRRRR